MTERSIKRGKLVYLNFSNGDMKVFGGEHFSFTLLSGGSLIQRAQCHIAESLTVERDSVFALDNNFRPTDAYMRIETNGSFTGTGLYHFSEREATCDAFTARDGRVTYRQSIGPGAFPFCSHAIVGDAWMIAAGAPDKDNTRSATTLLTSTLNKQGAAGPALLAIPYGIERVGEEIITVPAGTFETIHYKCGTVDMNHQLDKADFQYNMWLTKDDFCLAVKSEYPGRNRFELIELEDN